jgi:hypothetical protein
MGEDAERGGHHFEVHFHTNVKQQRYASAKVLIPT